MTEGEADQNAEPTGRVKHVGYPPSCSHCRSGCKHPAWNFWCNLYMGPITRNTSFCQSIRHSLELIFSANCTSRPLHQVSSRFSQFLRPVLQHGLVLINSCLDISIQQHFLSVKRCQCLTTVENTRGSHHMIFNLINECILSSMDLMHEKAPTYHV
jgi:hypothetical protein